MASEATEVAGHAAEAAEHAQGMPQLDFTTYPNQIFWLVVTLVVIYFMMTRVILPRISSVLAERAKTITSDLERAEELKQKAAEAEEALKKAEADAKAEARRIIEETKAEIQKDLEAAMKKAEAEIAKMAAASEEKIAEIRAHAVESVAAVATDVAQEIVSVIFPGKAKPEDVAAAVAKRAKG